ncbi:MAG: Rpn family recombination-promoting nuclease/putative transposase [Prevotella sp.]|nr:Rpn family recombination-promoting nuclease/putative transposase [Prevotella sp.]
MMDNIIRFDWAAKRMLRDKANFGVFEGLITVLLNEKVKIVELLESESNQEDMEDKFNRVDIKARNSKDEIILVEIQQTRELYYLQRILYGVAKAVSEHISSGESYANVKKVYSINILYFDLGKGADYLYHGQTKFLGVHTKDELKINTREKDSIVMTTPETIFPEYYLIRVNEFNKVATTPLEEWIEYLKSGTIKEDTTAPGLQEAKEKLQYLKMNREERLAYDRHIDNIRVEKDILETKVLEGLEEGRKQGRAEGRAEGEHKKMMDIAKKMKESGMDNSVISKMTGVKEEDLINI